MAIFGPPGDDAESPKGMGHMFGPHHISQLIDQAVSMCWMMMPNEKKNAVAVEIRRLVERTHANMKDDAKSFGVDEPDS